MVVDIPVVVVLVAGVVVIVDSEVVIVVAGVCSVVTSGVMFEVAGIVDANDSVMVDLVT